MFSQFFAFVRECGRPQDELQGDQANGEPGAVARREAGRPSERREHCLPAAGEALEPILNALQRGETTQAEEPETADFSRDEFGARIIAPARCVGMPWSSAAAQ